MTASSPAIDYSGLQLLLLSTSLLNMRILTLVQLNSAHSGSVSTAQFRRPPRSVAYFFGAAIAAISVGFVTPAIAQSQCASGNCGVDYYERPVSTTAANGGVVTTQTGIGLNVRSGPGLNYPVIGGADDGVYLDLAGNPSYADGYRWQQVTSGGWVATEYVAGGFENASYPGNCYQPSAYSYNGNCAGTGNSSGGTAYPTPAPVSTPRPISYRSGPYVVAVPGGDAATLYKVRRLSRVAFPDKAQQGAFINAGAFNDYDAARSQAHYLRANKLDARVIYK